jgi:hypothetical protein
MTSKTLINKTVRCKSMEKGFDANRKWVAVFSLIGNKYFTVINLNCILLYSLLNLCIVCTEQ